jgi:integrase
VCIGYAHRVTWHNSSVRVPSVYPGEPQLAEAKILTDAAIRKYAPGRTRRRIRDALAKSLFLVIEPSGHKSWQMRFRRPDGRPGKLTLGSFDASGREQKDDPEVGQPLTLAAARQLATAQHRRRALGEDVIADYKARKHRQRTELIDRSKNTFAAAVRAYVDDYARTQTRRWGETSRLLGLRPDDLEPIAKGLVQRWHDKPISEIDAHDVWSVVDEARRHSVPGLVARNKGVSEARARALHAALSAMFTWLQRQRRVVSNPCANLHRPLAPKARERVLNSGEIGLFWLACNDVGEPFKSIFRLLLLTGARLNEVAGMRRDELREDGTWQLPGSRTKNKRPHAVPLPPIAQRIIAAMSGQQQLVFTTTGQTPPSGWSRAKRKLDAAMLVLAQKERGANAMIPAWRLHDLRRTAVTGMAELGIRPDVIELVVNHVSGTRGGIAGVYNKSELLPERRAALERWAAHVAGLVSGEPANVVPLAGKRGRNK